MKKFLKHRSRRWGYDGWALAMKDSGSILDWTLSTTRQEARELQVDEFPELDLFQKTIVVKVRLKLEVVGR